MNNQPSSPLTLKESIEVTCRRLFPVLLENFAQSDSKVDGETIEECYDLDEYNRVTLRMFISAETSAQIINHSSGSEVLETLLSSNAFANACARTYLAGQPLDETVSFSVQSAEALLNTTLRISACTIRKF
ncbi:hypothetical protein GC174_17275 [bacterium]|nr:hypothetical protein [bacterium]